MQTENGFVFKVKTKNRVEQRKSIRKSMRSTKQPAHPHPKIHPRDYYQLIETNSDPVRLRQLLLWCAQASKPAKPSDLDTIVENVQKQVIQALKSKELSTSWYHRPQTKISTQEHPQNLENQNKIDGFNKQLERFLSERKQWEHLLQTHEEEHHVLKNAMESNTQLTYTKEEIAPYIQEELQFLSSQLPNVQDWLKQVDENLLIDSHALYHILHDCQVQVQDMNRSCQELTSKMLRAWQEHQQPVDPRQVLKLLE
ncbi:kinetochore-associated protein Dsn1/Mis13 [Gorgonomyces haynaldii]|nr:kinetochore-associated protein Dsn1/Mis13 [Gorgonomyces haynaldii]